MKNSSVKEYADYNFLKNRRNSREQTNTHKGRERNTRIYKFASKFFVKFVLLSNLLLMYFRKRKKIIVKNTKNKKQEQTICSENNMEIKNDSFRTQ